MKKYFNAQEIRKVRVFEIEFNEINKEKNDFRKVWNKRILSKKSDQRDPEKYFIQSSFSKNHPHFKFQEEEVFKSKSCLGYSMK